MEQLQLGTVSKLLIINQGAPASCQAAKILSHRKTEAKSLQMGAMEVIQPLTTVQAAVIHQEVPIHLEAATLGLVIIKRTVLLIRQVTAAEVPQQTQTAGPIISAADPFKHLQLTGAQLKVETFAAIHLKEISICSKQNSHV